jgi:hypothetical protein
MKDTTTIIPIAPKGMRGESGEPVDPDPGFTVI